MTNSTDSILQILKEVREARAKATQGKWEYGYEQSGDENYHVTVKEPKHKYLAQFNDWDNTPGGANALFITLAANRITQITEALEISVIGLADECCCIGEKTDLNGDEVLCYPCDIIKEINELLKETK